MPKKIKITDLVLRDGHQSLLATRMLTSDMLGIANKLDKVGFFSLETWGGATFDSCIRYLNEDPWVRIRKLKEAMPNTKMQMLLRGQNLLGYRHYADDVVDKFVELASKNGVDIFRIFDALNDIRNLERSIKAVKKNGKHAQGAISYTVTPVHTLDKYVEMAIELEKLGVDSIAIKDMSGLITPYDAYNLISEIKKKTSLPLVLHSHATTGMSVAALIKGVEAGVDIVDTTISSLSMGTSHSPTETIVWSLKGTEYDTGLDMELLSEIADYFREVRKKYADFESSFTGVDTRILLSQVPGGMLSNLESQLKEQNASNKMADVLKEIQLVQKDFGYPPLVTPTSQIVGTQAVFNVLFGRYNKLTGESKSLLIGKYGRTPIKPDESLVKKALQELGIDKITESRPADDIPNELDKLRSELKEKIGDGFTEEDLLTYAMFPQIATKFFENRDNGPVDIKPSSVSQTNKGTNGKSSVYMVNVDGKDYKVSVREEGQILISNDESKKESKKANNQDGVYVINAPVSGSIFKLIYNDGDKVKVGDTVVIIESMKMELEIKSGKEGHIEYFVNVGDKVDSGMPLVEIL